MICSALVETDSMTFSTKADLSRPASHSTRERTPRSARCVCTRAAQCTALHAARAPGCARPAVPTRRMCALISRSMPALSVSHWT